MQLHSTTSASQPGDTNTFPERLQACRLRLAGFHELNACTECPSWRSRKTGSAAISSRAAGKRWSCCNQIINEHDLVALDDGSLRTLRFRDFRNQDCGAFCTHISSTPSYSCQVWQHKLYLKAYQNPLSFVYGPLEMVFGIFPA